MMKIFVIMESIPVVYVDNPKIQIEYKCTLCDFKTTIFVALHKHKVLSGHDAKASTNVKVSKTNEKLKFQCNQCNEQFFAASKLKYHRRKKHPKETYSCNKCSKCFNSKSILETHVQRMHGEKNLQCDKCKKYFSLNYDLQKHILIHTKESICSMCNKKMNILQLRRHMKEVHILATYSCDHCSLICKTARRLTKHIKSSHGIKEFMCSICSKMFGLEDRLKMHMRFAHGEKIYQCDKCDYKSRHGLSAHLKAKHNVDNNEHFICNVCDFECLDIKQLADHKKDNHPDIMIPKRSKPRKERDHSCKICGEKFNCKQTKLVHKWKVHDGITYNCEYENCSYKTYQKGTLKKHIISNHLNTIEKCTFCTNTFKEKSSLQNHMIRLHTDKVKLFSCDKCTYRCLSKSQLLRHLTYKDRKHD